MAHRQHHPGIDLWQTERACRGRGYRWIAGVDEAGRGPLAGPVVAAAVIFSEGVEIAGVDDSKKLTAAHRERLFESIQQQAESVGVGIVDVGTIDRVNILQATMLAMEEALVRLAVRPDHVLVDGNRFTVAGYDATTVVGGDGKCFSIAAASIIAKVTRDRLMIACDAAYPQYGFLKHKGYGTLEHREAILRFGPCPLHRTTFLRKLLGDDARAAEASVTPHAVS